jgi:ATP-dependent RNA helicase DHX8/PRP22
VWVKVISIVGDKIGLSMREVDQNSGQELERKTRVNEYDQALSQHPMLQQNKKGSMYGSLTGVKLDNPEETKVKKAKRISSPELWELSRLKYNSRLVDLEDEFKRQNQQSESEGVISDSEDLEIDMNDNEPPFLRG